MTRLSEDEFVDQFQPETDENGDYYRQRDWTDAKDAAEILKANADNRLWTAVEDDDGNWCLVSGYHFVNRLYYVICAVPYMPDDSYCVPDDMAPEDHLDDDWDDD